MSLDDGTLLFILGFLTLSVGLNFWLTFRLIRAFRRIPLPEKEVPQPLPEGAQVADISLDRLTDQKPFTFHDYPEYAKVLVFLNSKCEKCKAKLPELSASIQKTHDLGLFIWIVSLEKQRRMRSFFQDDTLLAATMRPDQATYDYLNPQAASPYYLFIDAENTLQAQGMIGDENWTNFIAQLEPELQP